MPTRSWTRRFERWLEPFLEAFAYKKQRHWAPVYLEGLLRPGRRKSVEPMAERVAPGEVQQLHNFVSTSRWDIAPVEKVLVVKATAMVGGPEAHRVVDDTALVKKGTHSVGVARQYCGELGKRTGWGHPSAARSRGSANVPGSWPGSCLGRCSQRSTSCLPRNSMKSTTRSVGETGSPF